MNRWSGATGNMITPKNMAVPELRAQLKRLGHDSTGMKSTLIRRLEDALVASRKVLDPKDKTLRVHSRVGPGSLPCVKLCLAELRFHDVSFKQKFDLLFVSSWRKSEEEIHKLKPGQCVNRFPGLESLAQKAALSDALRAAGATYEGLMPRTWVLPRDFNLLEKRDGKGMQSGCTYLLKPDAGNQGTGICIVQQLSEVKNAIHSTKYVHIQGVSKKRCASSPRAKENPTPTAMVWVLQEYVPRPLLLGGLKFDLRLYVMLAGLDPLRVFLCKTGMVRFCTEAYEAPSKDNMKNTCMHLTNYSVNKHHDNFTRAKRMGNDSGSSTEDEQGKSHKQEQGFENIGSKRLLQSVLAQMRDQGRNVEGMWKQVQQLVVKTVHAMQPTLQAEYDKWDSDTWRRHERKQQLRKELKQGGFKFGKNKSSSFGEVGGCNSADAGHEIGPRDSQKENGNVGVLKESNCRCFHIIGFDVLLDEDLKPWLLEINHSPSFNIEATEGEISEGE
jgi:hypothetical protein